METEVIDVKLTDKDEEKTKREFNFEEFLENNKFTVGLFILGVILLGAGVLGFKIFSFSSNGPKVEILGEQDIQNKSEKTVSVEAAGEVIKPGVYSLPFGSRINDLLITAGGLTANADREWTAKNVNLAQKLEDGAKIYIPSETQNLIRQLADKTQNQNLNLKTNETKININTASESELDTLWGVGPATAQKIIGGRPYQKAEELQTKKIVKSNVWQEIKEKVTVY